MRKFLLPSLFFLGIFVFSAPAQSSRVSALAKQLQQNVGSLADASAKEFFARANNSRDQINNFLILQQAKLSGEILLVLVNTNRPAPEIRETADSLNERFSRYNADPSSRLQKQQIEKDIEELIAELKKSGTSSDNKPDRNNASRSTLEWHGTVDDEVHLMIRGSVVQTKTISGTEYTDAIFNFSSPLPEETVQVFVNKKEGRGTAKVIQQPSAANDWTAIVQILDKNGGAREYDLEIYWTR